MEWVRAFVAALLAMVQPWVGPVQAPDGPGHVEPAKLTPAAKPQPDGTLIYPRTA